MLTHVGQILTTPVLRSSHTKSDFVPRRTFDLLTVRGTFVWADSKRVKTRCRGVVSIRDRKRLTSGQSLDSGDSSILDKRELRNFDEVGAANSFCQWVSTPLHHHVLHRVTVYSNGIISDKVKHTNLIILIDLSNDDFRRQLQCHTSTRWIPVTPGAIIPPILFYESTIWGSIKTPYLKHCESKSLLV